MPTYKKVKVIGQGAFGKAYLVRDDNDKDYVMKTVDMSKLDQAAMESSLNEARVLSSLKPHPFIVRYHQSYIHEKQLCIIMDFASGGDVYTKVKDAKKSGNSIPEKQVVRWVTQVCLGMKYLHEKHILHRDLKTQNLFLNSKGDILIGDLGIAKVLESTLASAQTAIGTPYYLSPELCQNQKYSFPSDIWAIGCILYELAALQVPFQGDDLKILVEKICRAPIPNLPRSYSDSLNDLFKNIMERTPQQRLTIQQILRSSIIQKEIDSMMKEHKQNKSSKSDHKKDDRHSKSEHAVRPKAKEERASSSVKDKERTSSSEDTDDRKSKKKQKSKKKKQKKRKNDSSSSDSAEDDSGNDSAHKAKKTSSKHRKKKHSKNSKASSSSDDESDSSE